MKQEFKDCYINLFKDGLKHFKNMQHIKLTSIKSCSLKAFNHNFMSNILKQKKKPAGGLGQLPFLTPDQGKEKFGNFELSNSDDENDETQVRRQKLEYDLEVITMVEVE